MSSMALNSFQPMTVLRAQGPPSPRTSETLLGHAGFGGSLADKAKDLVRALHQAREECAKLRAAQDTDTARASREQVVRLQDERNVALTKKVLLERKNAALEALVATLETKTAALETVVAALKEKAAGLEDEQRQLRTILEEEWELVSASQASK